MFKIGLTASDIMQSPVITVKETMTVEEVSDLLVGRMISGAPVVNADNLPIGVVTLNDIVRNEPRREHIISEKVASDYVLQAWEPQFNSEELTGYHLEESETLYARDIMTPFVYHVDKHTSLQEIAKVLITAHIHRVFVYDVGQIVGVVSTLDILKTAMRVGNHTPQQASATD